MKKLFFIAAIAGAALVSCTKNELAPSATEQHEITFASPVASTVTKAVNLVESTLYPAEVPFYVFADHHMDEFEDAQSFTSYMRGTDQKGVPVTYRGGDIVPGEDEGTASNPDWDAYWAPTTKYYWPMDGYLTFAAYSTGLQGAALEGYTGFNYTVEKGLELTEYTIETDLTNQYDLMLSNRAVDRTKADMAEGTDNVHYDGVEIQFNHVLSAIKFAVRTDETSNEYATANYSLSLVSLKVVNAYTTANLIQFPGEGETMWSGHKNEAIITNTAEGTRTGGYPVRFENNQVTALNRAGISFSGDTDADLTLLPQALDHGTNDVTVEIVYTVSHPDMGMTGTTQNSITYTKYLPLAGTSTNNTAITTWEAGKRYIYTIVIGMEEIKFAPTIVTDWSDVTIDVPENAVVPSTGA